MADRTVKLVLGVNIAGLQSGLQAATRATEDFAKKSVSAVERNSGAINGMANTLGAVGIAATGLATVAVKKFAEFDKSMSGVKAATGETGKAMDNLRQAALDAGAQTSFSATEAAGAIEELAKAGISTADILGGGLTGALDLAAAGQLGVADAAGYAATAMTQFKLSGSDVGHVADLLAAGAGKAMGEVSDFGQALNQAGLVASATGLSIEQTVGSLAAFASAGMVGSDAGTSLKTMLQRLSAPTGEAAKLMEQLGISAYDANGQFVGLDAVAGQLTRAFENKTDAERNSAMATLFGADAVRAANVLYTEGEQGIRDWTAAVNDQGYAAEYAATLLDNLSGDIEGLGGALETALIGAGEGANGPLRWLVQSATDAVNAFSALPPAVQQGTALLVGGGGLVALGVAGLGKLATATVGTIGTLRTMGVITDATAGKITSGMGRGAKAVGALGAAVAAGYAVWQVYQKLMEDVTNSTQTYVQALESGVDPMAAFNQGLAEAIAQGNKPGIFDDITNFFGATTDAPVIDLLSKAGVAVEDMGAAIRGSKQDYEDFANRIYDLAEAGAITGDEARKIINTTAQQQEAWANATKQADATKAAQDGLAGSSEGLADATGEAAGAMGDATGQAQQLTEALDELFDAQRKAAGVVLSERDAHRQLNEALDDATKTLKENGKTLDVTTAKGRANQAALDDIADSGWELVESMRNAGASGDALGKAMGSVREDFIRTATSMGMPIGTARELADQLGLIPKDVKTTVTAHDKASSKINDIKRILAAMPDYTTVNVTADTSAAYRKIAALNAALRQVGSRTRVATGAGGSGGLTMASGGQVVGGTPGRDSVLARLMPGEHVLTTADVIALGGQAGVYALRAALHGGIAAFAGGGAVGRWTSAANTYQRQANALARRLIAERRRRPRTAAIAKRIDQLEDQLEKAREKRDNARDRAADYRVSGLDLAREIRRGEFTSAATGGLSSARGLVDQLVAASRDVNLTRAQRKSMATAANQAEAAFKKLYAQAEKLDTRLTSARDKVAELASIKASAASAIAQGFSLAEAAAGTETVNPWTGAATTQAASGRSILAGAQQFASKVKTFAGLIDQLRKRGFTGAILSEVAAMGVEAGTPAAQALLQLSGSQARSMNQAYADIQKWAGVAGQTVTEGYAAGGLAAAESFVKGLEKQQASIDKQLATWGTKIGNQLLKTIAGPSAVPKRALGGPVSAGQAYLVGEQGAELFRPTQAGWVLSADATRRLAGSVPGAGGNVQVRTEVKPLSDQDIRRLGEYIVRASTNVATTTVDSAFSGLATTVRGGVR